LPSPAKKGAVQIAGATLEPEESEELVAFVFKTLSDPFTGRLNLFKVFQGVLGHDSHVVNCRTHNKERVGQLLVPQGEDHSEHADEFGPGDIGAVAKLKDTHAGDVLASGDTDVPIGLPEMPNPVMAFAMEPKAKGDEDKVFTALRRLQEEDPTIDVHRDEETGEQIVAGLTQIHVEVIAGADEGALRRGGHPEAPARALPGDDPRRRQGPRALQRSRRAAAASSPTATSRSSRCPRAPASSS